MGTYIFYVLSIFRYGKVEITSIIYNLFYTKNNQSYMYDRQYTN